MSSIKSPIKSLHRLGMIQDSTISIDLIDRYCGQSSQTIYCGFDPTASSLHVGHLSTMLQLVKFGLHGHKPIALLGGATAQIGDPSGKSIERPLLSTDDILNNSANIQSQLENICSNIHLFGKELSPESRIQYVNNLDWFSEFNILEFLRQVGKRFRVSSMLSRDSVSSRLESDVGISFTEFTYQILQGYDFYHLYKNHNCSIQLGGSDQWGNIVSGIDLIKKMAPDADVSEDNENPVNISDSTLLQPCGITMPLILDSKGKKFGKTEGNAIWLSPDLTSPFSLYQFFIRQPDSIVTSLLQKLTLLEEEEIQKITSYLSSDLSKELNPSGELDGSAQKQLAKHVTLLLHSESGLKAAEMATNLLYNPKNVSDSSFSSLDKLTLQSMFENVPSSTISHISPTDTILDILLAGNVLSSKKQVTRLFSSGGLYLNNCRISENRNISPTDITHSTLIFRKGKQNYHLVKLTTT